MSKILPVLFVLILGMVGVGMDFYLFRQGHEGQAIGFVDYVKSRANGAVAAAETASGMELAAADAPADAAAEPAEGAEPVVKEKPAVVSLTKGGKAPSATTGGCVRRAGKLDCPAE